MAGELLLTYIAWQFRAWQWLTALPCIFLGLVVFVWPWCPESVRWLLQKGRHNEAEAQIIRMAKVNRKPDLNLDDHRQDQSDGRPINEGLLDVIKSPKLALRFTNSCFCWMTVTMVYYGLSLNATNLAGSPYTNFVLVALVEIPGYAFSYFTMERMGRRISTALSLILGGACCIATAILATYAPTQHLLMTITFLLGKLGVTWTFGNIYIYTSELFPTSARTACVGACSTSGRIGAIVSPYIAGLALTQPWLPMAIFGSMAFTSGTLVMLFLPETLGMSLPETVSEAANQAQVQDSTNDDEHDPLI